MPHTHCNAQSVFDTGFVRTLFLALFIAFLPSSSYAATAQSQNADEAFNSIKTRADAAWNAYGPIIGGAPYVYDSRDLNQVKALELLVSETQKLRREYDALSARGNVPVISQVKAAMSLLMLYGYTPLADDVRSLCRSLPTVGIAQADASLRILAVTRSLEAYLRYMGERDEPAEKKYALVDEAGQLYKSMPAFSPADQDFVVMLKGRAAAYLTGIYLEYDLLADSRHMVPGGYPADYNDESSLAKILEGWREVQALSEAHEQALEGRCLAAAYIIRAIAVRCGGSAYVSDEKQALAYELYQKESVRATEDDEDIAAVWTKTLMVLTWATFNEFGQVPKMELLERIKAIGHNRYLGDAKYVILNFAAGSLEDVDKAMALLREARTMVSMATVSHPIEMYIGFEMDSIREKLEQAGRKSDIAWLEEARADMEATAPEYIAARKMSILTPWGSFRESCRDFTLDAKGLRASCRTDGGTWQDASLAVEAFPCLDIANVNGALSCVKPQ